MSIPEEKPQVFFVSWKGYKVQSPYKYRRTIIPLHIRFPDATLLRISETFSHIEEDYDLWVKGFPLTSLEKSLLNVSPIDNKIRTFLAQVWETKLIIIITASTLKRDYVLQYEFEMPEEKLPQLKKIIVKRRTIREINVSYKIMYKKIYELNEYKNSILGLILISLLKKFFNTVVMIINAVEYLKTYEIPYLWIEKKKVKVQIPVDDC